MISAPNLGPQFAGKTFSKNSSVDTFFCHYSDFLGISRQKHGAQLFVDFVLSEGEFILNLSCFYVAGLYGSITIETNATSYTVRMTPHSLFLSLFYFSPCIPPSLFLSRYLSHSLQIFTPPLSVSLGIFAHLPVRYPCVSSLQKNHQVGAREAGSYHKVEIARRDLFDVVAFIGMERRISSPLLPWPPSKCTIRNMSFFPMLWEVEAL